eukprot:1768065-Rhodomonas_salina.1
MSRHHTGAGALGLPDPLLRLVPRERHGPGAGTRPQPRTCHARHAQRHAPRPLLPPRRTPGQEAPPRLPPRRR